jgi:hypothetical protein
MAALLIRGIMPRRVQLPDPVFEAARVAGAAAGRDPDSQVDHWVRVGRAIERSGIYTYAEITYLLARDRAAESSTDPLP